MSTKTSGTSPMVDAGLSEASQDALEAASKCGCRHCITDRGDLVHGLPRLLTEMVVCHHCGDKRCLHAYNHRAPCAKVDLHGHNTWVERMALYSQPASTEDMPQMDAVIALGAWAAPSQSPKG